MEESGFRRLSKNISTSLSLCLFHAEVRLALLKIESICSYKLLFIRIGGLEVNRFDNEDKIISQFQEVNDNEVMFATQSETIEAVYSSIHTEALWKNWINSSGKSDPPPD